MATLVTLLVVFLLRNAIVCRVRIRRNNVIHKEWQETNDRTPVDQFDAGPSYDRMLWGMPLKWTYRQFYGGSQ